MTILCGEMHFMQFQNLLKHDFEKGKETFAMVVKTKRPQDMNRAMGRLFGKFRNCLSKQLAKNWLLQLLFVRFSPDIQLSTFANAFITTNLQYLLRQSRHAVIHHSVSFHC
jgi:hypothetical protein